jgi:outer membrane protein
MSEKACMNVDNGNRAERRNRAFVMAVTILMCSTPALAAGALNSLSSVLSDPYRTQPALPADGRALPGDAGLVECTIPRTSETIELSLSKAVDLALCNNSKIRAAWASIKERSAGLGVASAALMPTMSMTAGRERTDTGYPGTTIPAYTAKGNTINGSLNWRLFDFGAREADRQAANSLLLAAIHNHDAVVQQIMADTVQAYFDAQSADAVLRAKTWGVTIAQTILDSARRRESTGVVSHNDTLQAATALARANLDLNRATGDFRKALSVLVYAMGLPANSRVEINSDDDDGPDSKSDSALSSIEELNHWLRVTERNHPAILAADAQLQASQSGVASARAQGMPTLDLSASYYRNGYPNQGLSTNRERIGNIGLFISIPIFSGFSHRYQLRQAKAVAEERQADLDDTRHDVLMQVVKAHADARASLSNLSSSNTLLLSAENSLQSSQRRYDKGAADIVEILNAQKALAEAKQEHIRCLSEWRAARLRLMAEAGLLGHAELAEPAADRALQVPIKESQPSRD